MCQQVSPSQLGHVIAVAVAGTLGSGDSSLAALGPPTTADIATNAAYWQLVEAMIDAWNNRPMRGTRLQLWLKTSIDYFIGGADARGQVSSDFLGKDGA